jgi:fructose-bisphosphate aldolase class II
MEIGITGGEEDGVNNENAKAEDLYSKPEEVWQVVESFNKVPNSKNMYSIAAAFGNVHGVYKAGNVKLSPEILGKARRQVLRQVLIINMCIGRHFQLIIHFF